MYEQVMRASVLAWAAVLLVAVVPGTRPARADDRTTAKLAYDQAEALRAQGKWAEACPLYAASYNADPQLGALLHLAACHEQIGMVASAWLEWTDAIDVARQRHDSRETMAKQHADALAPKVSRLSVTLPGDAIAGLKIAVDGHDVTVVATRGVPLDPGTHEVTAEAPGRQPWKSSVTIDKPGETTTLPIPALEVIATPPPEPTPTPTPAPTPEQPTITTAPPAHVDTGAPATWGSLAGLSFEGGIGETTAPKSNQLYQKPQAGLTLRAAIGKRFGKGAVTYVVQLAYAHKGGKYDFERPIYSGSTGVGYNLHYLQVPVTVRWRAGGATTHLELGAGGYVAAGIHADYGPNGEIVPPKVKNFKPYDVGVELRASLVIGGIAITGYVDASPITPSDEVSGGIETALVLVGYELP